MVSKPREIGKGGSWAQATKTVRTLPENRSGSLKVPSGPVQSEKSCDDKGKATLDNRGRRAGWSPNYNRIQTRNYQSEWARHQKSLDLRPVFYNRGLMIFKSQRRSGCESYVVRTPDFDASEFGWWLNFPSDLFEMITPLFWSDWPPNWVYPPSDVNPFINGEPYET